MNPLAAIIAVLASLKQDIRARFNAALQGLPPVEQIEGGNTAACLLSEIEWAIKRVDQVGTDIGAAITAAESKLSGFKAQEGEALEATAARMLDLMTANATAEALTLAVNAGTHMPKPDHDAAVTEAVRLARESLTTELEQQFNASLENIRLAATRRTELVTRFGAAAAVITDAQLAAENHEALATLLEARLATMTELGITAEASPVSHASLLEIPLDEAGTASFEARIGMIRETLATAAAVKVNAAAPDPKPAAAAPAVESGAPAKRSAVC